MKKRKFLVPVAALAAAFSADQAVASVPEELATAHTDVQATLNLNLDGRVSVKKNDDTFNFILKRGEEGSLMAYHESHASHASHASHSSHTSSHY